MKNGRLWFRWILLLLYMHVDWRLNIELSEWRILCILCIKKYVYAKRRISRISFLIVCILILIIFFFLSFNLCCFLWKKKTRSYIFYTVWVNWINKMERRDFVIFSDFFCRTIWFLGLCNINFVLRKETRVRVRSVLFLFYLI